MSAPAQFLAVIVIGIIVMMIIAAITRRGLKVSRHEIDFPPREEAQPNPNERQMLPSEREID